MKKSIFAIALFALFAFPQNASAQIFDKMERALDKLTGNVEEQQSEKPATTMENIGDCKGMTLKFKSLEKDDSGIVYKFELKSGKTPYSHISLSAQSGITVEYADSVRSSDILITLGKKTTTNEASLDILPGKKYPLKVRVLDPPTDTKTGKISLVFEGDSSSRFGYCVVFRRD